MFIFCHAVVSLKFFRFMQNKFTYTSIINLWGEKEIFITCLQK
tara:strand:+ start:22414 stop:22542 length:129 start_codon:yes stop_codon:yes gene_type:complete